MSKPLAYTSALFFALGCAFASACGIFAGCSSNDTGSSSGTAGTSASSGSSGDPDASGSGAAGSNGGTPSSSVTSGDGGTGGGDAFAACISTCETQHPTGTQIGKGIDQCWAKSCYAQCNGIGAGKAIPPAHGACMNIVETPSADCSQCTVDHCCAAWDACFNDPDCSALNKCSIACYK